MLTWRAHVSRELLQHEFGEPVSVPLTGVASSGMNSGYLTTLDVVKLPKMQKLYLVISSMTFSRPAVIIMFLKVPLYAKAFRILQAPTTSMDFWLLAKRDNSGKISAWINACRTSSEFRAISWHISNTHFLHSSSEILLCRGLQGSSVLV